ADAAGDAQGALGSTCGGEEKLPSQRAALDRRERGSTEFHTLGKFLGTEDLAERVRSRCHAFDERSQRLSERSREVAAFEQSPARLREQSAMVAGGFYKGGPPSIAISRSSCDRSGAMAMTENCILAPSRTTRRHSRSMSTFAGMQHSTSE